MNPAELSTPMPCPEKASARCLRNRENSGFELLPGGSQVGVPSVHACITAAAYDYFQIIENGAITGRRGRVDGWLAD